jgi:Co/Zn/Cd efflux system component
MLVRQVTFCEIEQGITPMSHDCHDHCHDHAEVASQSPKFRRALWIALWVNALMFVVDIVASHQSGSIALLADAIDFAGDAVSYGLSLVVLSMALVWQSRVALLKGISMGLYGLLVLGKVAWAVLHGQAPEPILMGMVGTLALLANVSVALMLYAFRDGNANMRSVWLCTRNDAIGNVAVLLAAAGVLGTMTAWPDLLVATAMACLAIHSAWSVVRHAQREMSTAGSHAHH